jgi:hypothetical protein
MPRCPVVTQGESAGSTAIKIGNTVLSHVGLPGADIDSFYSKPIDNKLLLVLKTKDQTKRWMLMDADGLPKSEPLSTEQVLRDLLFRTDLTEQQRNGIQASLASPEQYGDGSDIRLFVDVPLLADCNGRPIEYVEEPVLPARALVGITGEAGCGKSSLVSAIAARVARQGRRVLLLDRDNPLSIVHDRFKRLGIADGPSFRVWGGWCRQEPCSLDSPWIVSFVDACEPKPLIILDSLGAFYDGDENDAAHMRAFFRPARDLVNMGATVSILHNDGKSGTSRDYRGSAAFKDSLDAAWHVSNSKKDGLLDRLTVRSYKNRFGFVGKLVYVYAGGKMVLSDAPKDGEAQALIDKLTKLLSQNPGAITIIDVPEAESATRISQQLCQLAKGCARLDRRPAVNEQDLMVVRRVAFDCMPPARRNILDSLIDGSDAQESLPATTRRYAVEELVALGVLDASGDWFARSAVQLVKAGLV